jgi:dephospho-CoA kinase
VADRTRVIGLTGNIACGKSTVAAMLRELGAEVIDADLVARRLMTPPGPVFDAVVREFGREIVAPNGTIDRAKLGGIVFSDPAALRRLDQLVHPATSAAIRKLVVNSTKPVVVVEAIKLLEAGTHRICDAVWVVTCEREQQIDRLVTMRGLSYQDAEKRVAAQAAAREKLARADAVIDASGSLADTRRQVIRKWENFVGHD